MAIGFARLVDIRPDQSYENVAKQDACIVIRTDGVGSAALYPLARRGLHALGLNRFPPGHDRGSSHGDTCIIRLAYLEHPDYVPLLRPAFVLWEELEQQTSQQPYRETGFLQIGPTVQGALTSARQHQLTTGPLSASEVEQRFPRFRAPESMSAVLDPRARSLRMVAHAKEAVKLGAEVRTGETVPSWQPDGSGLIIATDQERYAAQNVILTAGAWAADFLRALLVPREVRRKALFWYGVNNRDYAVGSGCPNSFYELPAADFYEFPQIDQSGLKIAEHSGGQPVSDPLNLELAIDTDEQSRMERFLHDYMPGVTSTCLKHVACMYTMSPDEHFIVDHHPEHPQIAFAAGLSEHEFKFVGALGEALMDLAIDGHLRLPIDFLSYLRFLHHDAA